MPLTTTGEPDFGTLMRGFRQRALLTQEELASRTGLSARTIRRLESSQLRRPRQATIRVLAHHLDLTAEEQAALVAAADADPRPESSPPGSPVAAAGPDELPADIPDFTGRPDLVAAVCAALSGKPVPGAPGTGRARLIGVSGPPGVGKTTLCVHVAHLLRSCFPDGRLYVDLRGTADRPLPPAEALSRLLRRTAGADAVLPDDLDERAAMFRATVADRRILVVLDDAHTEAQVRPLLPGGAGCAVLLTSRATLAALDSLVGFDLGVFRPNETVDLLTRVLGAWRVAAEPAAADAIGQLCGNLPLAVRIVAARLSVRPHWTLRHIADQLADEHHRLDALSVGDRAVRGSVGLSYQALDTRSRQLFQRLGAYTDTEVPAWVAAALMDVPEQVAEDLIEGLVDARLVEVRGCRRGTRSRYDMHSLVRLYARERYLADEPEADRAATALRMLGGWLYLAEQAQARLPGGLPRIGVGDAPRWQVPGRVATDALADATGWFETERLALAAAVETACTGGFDELAWDLAGCVGRFLEVGGYYDLWRCVLEQVLTAVRATGNRRGEAHVLRGLAEQSLDTDEYQQARAHLRGALRLFEELDEPLAAAHAQRAIGVLERIRGDNAAAARRFERALAVFQAAGDRVGLADTLFSLGALHRDQGRTADALSCYEQALALETELGNRFNQALLLCSVGSTLLAQDRIAQAREALTRGLATAREVQQGEAFALSFLGEADTRAGDTDAAATHLASALEIFERVGDRYGEAVTLRNLGELHRTLGEFDRAGTALDRALELWDQLDTPQWQARTLVSLGRLRLSTGDHVAARAAWEAADDLFRRLGSVERAPVASACV